MAYYSAMAKVVTVLCVAFLVAHVESGRLLKQYDNAGVTAETFPSSQEVPETTEAFAELHAEGPVAAYNYNLPADNTPINEEALADEGLYATEGIVVGETTADPSPAQESYVFDARQEDAPVLTTEDTTTQDFEALPDSQEGVEPVYDDSTSLAVNTPKFEFQENPDEEVSQGGGPGFFAFDDSLASP